MPPYIGEIRTAAFNFPVRGWVPCDGRELFIEEFMELFSLIGTTYGGDGEKTFAVPDFRGRSPLHRGDRRLGETGVIRPSVSNQYPIESPARESRDVSATLAMNFMISPFGLFPLFEGVQVQTEAAPFLCEGRMFAFERAPAGWAYCDGQLMPIKGNAALYALLGPMYGGDGKKAFALPDLRDSIPMEYAPDSLRGAGNNPVKRDSAAIMKSADTLTNTSVGFLAINYCICVDGPLPSRDRSA